MKKLIPVLLCFAVGFLVSCQKQTTADDVVNMMTEASGGTEALAALTDAVITGEITTVEGPMTMPVTVTAKRPNKIRIDLYAEGSIVESMCYDGTTGWVIEMGQRQDMPEAQLQEFESLATTWIDGYLNYQDKGFTLELLADEVVDEQNYMVLQVTDKYGNFPDSMKKCYINPDTHFIERESGNMVAGGEWQPMVRTIKDYKMVDGIAWWHYMAQHNASGEMIWEFTLKEIKHNTGVDDAVFMAETMSMK